MNEGTFGCRSHRRLRRHVRRPGAEPRLRILRALLAAHPDGMVVGEIQSELAIAASTLSHHLEKLKNEDLITVRRESTFLRYTANTAALEELLGFPVRRVLHP